MAIDLTNERLKITIASKGAELTGLRDLARGRELLWTAEPTVWARHAPILFPIVGRLAGDRARHEQSSVEMRQHGFARDREFELLARSASACHWQLRSDSTSRAVYPYEFALDIHYSLRETSLGVAYVVRNLGEQTMPFSIGAHPGFRCPWQPGDRYEDYYVEFESPERAERIDLVDGLRSGGRTPALHGDRVLALSRDLFQADALIFDQLQSQRVSLRSRSREGGLRMHFPGFPYFAIWSRPSPDANFVCFEPWFGIADAVGPEVAFKDKEGSQSLAPGATFECGYQIEVL